MSTPSYKVGVAITVIYQADKASTGETVAMDVYDEAQVLDVGQSVVAMPEIGATGRYIDEFTPDAEGAWVVLLSDGSNKGEVVSHYAVVGHDLDSIGDVVDTIGAHESPAMVG